MTPHSKNWKLWAEATVLALIVFPFTIVSGWCDPDIPFNYDWFYALTGIGLLFGIFGRLPILLMIPVAGFVFFGYSVFWTRMWLWVGGHTFLLQAM
jgi:hypothetical protein